MPSEKSKIRTVKLNKKNSKKFNERFKKGITIVGFFMKPKRCPHCDALKPTWNDLMRKYSALSSNMPCQLATSIQGTESLIDSLDDDDRSDLFFIATLIREQSGNLHAAKVFIKDALNF